MTKSSWLIGAFFLFGFFLLSNNVVAQFSYGGLRLSYHNARFDKGNDLGGTRIRDFVLNVDLVHRPIRNFGIGISARLPIIHGFKYQYVLGERYDETVDGGGLFEEDKAQYEGGDFEYIIKNTYSLTFFGRIYFDTEKNYFFDMRYTVENYNESFSYNRSGSSLPDQNFSYTGDAKASGIGFSIGTQPKINDHFYFMYQFTIDFLSSDVQNFSYDIHTNSGPKAKVYSKIEGSQTAYEFSMGFGYTF